MMKNIFIKINDVIINVNMIVGLSEKESEKNDHVWVYTKHDNDFELPLSFEKAILLFKNFGIEMTAVNDSEAVVMNHILRISKEDSDDYVFFYGEDELLFEVSSVFLDQIKQIYSFEVTDEEENKYFSKESSTKIDSIGNGYFKKITICLISIGFLWFLYHMVEPYVPNIIIFLENT